MADHHHPTPVQRLGRLLGLERADLAVLTAYTLVIILLSLAVPLAMQALVNTVAAGLFRQPLVVLALLVFGGLMLAGGLQIIQIGVVETLQRRIFARTALELAHRLARVRADALRDEYAPELVNRFFDVLTVQKSLSKILVDGFTAFMTAGIGIFVLGFYSPVLLAVDVAIVVGFVGGALLLGIGGLRTSIAESKTKYKVANWLEDVARTHVSMKVHGNPEYITDRADALVLKYLEYREEHFSVNRRQLIGHFFFVALASAGILAAGGWLVLSGALTLGQLVAAQIIVTTVLVSLDKLIRQADVFYDLLTGLDKVGHVIDLPVEREGGRKIPQKTGLGCRVRVRGVSFSYRPDRPVLDNLDFSLDPGERVSLVGASGEGKSTLAALLCGLETASHGSVEIDGVDLREIDLGCLRAEIGLAAFNNEVFDGTIEENVHAGRTYVTAEDVRWALEIADFEDDVAKMTKGLKTRVLSGGQNLSHGQIQRLLIARAIVGRPRLLILDEAFTGIDECVTSRILDRIFDGGHPWTIVDISHEPQIMLRTGMVAVLSGGKIAERGTPEALSANPDGPFSRLFPFVSAGLRGERVRIRSATGDVRLGADAFGATPESPRPPENPPAANPAPTDPDAASKEGENA